MEPYLHDGQLVLVWRWGKIRPGDIVVFFHGGLLMIKRARQKRGNKWEVRADNLGESSDSLDFGLIPEKNIVGKVLGRYC